MVPVVDGSVTPDRATDSETLPVPLADPVRLVIHALLALYLSPVILVVFLIGATSIVSSKAAKLLSQVSFKFPHRKGTGLNPVTKTSKETRRPRLIFRRKRSHSAR
jgi:hypothetical protein